jgi:hypothetical protein
MEQMQIEIDDSILDDIIVERFKKDYISAQADIHRLLSKGFVNDFEREDLWMFKETANALEVLLRYYMYLPEANAWIKENS